MSKLEWHVLRSRLVARQPESGTASGFDRVPDHDECPHHRTHDLRLLPEARSPYLLSVHTEALRKFLVASVDIGVSVPGMPASTTGPPWAC